MKNMILSFKMKADVISDHFLMLWFQKDSVDTVSFRTYGGGSKILNQKVTFWVLNVPMGVGVECGGHRFRTKPWKYHIFAPSLTSGGENVVLEQESCNQWEWEFFLSILNFRLLASLGFLPNNPYKRASLAWNFLYFANRMFFQAYGRVTYLFLLVSRQVRQKLW